MPFKDHAKALKYWHDYNKKRYSKIKWRYHNDSEFREHKKAINKKHWLKVKDTLEYKEKARIRQQKYRDKKKQKTIELLDDDDEWDDSELNDFSF